MLITSDLHLTDNHKHEYRWDIFPWLLRLAKKHHHRSVYILGDITDRKDHHSSVLVNRIVKNLRRFVRAGIRLHILMGNHDYIDSGLPYLSFLSRIPEMSYYRKPTFILDEGRKILLVPHTRNPEKTFSDLFIRVSKERPDMLYMHQTVSGAKASNGTDLTGLSMRYIRDLDCPIIISGDVHGPQKCGKVEYVGSPYPVRFGDTYSGRVFEITDTGRKKSIRYRSIKKEIVHIVVPTDLEALLKYSSGDQLRIKVNLPIEHIHFWKQLKTEIINICSEAGIVLDSLSVHVDPLDEDVSNGSGSLATDSIESISDIEVVNRYCDLKNVDDTVRKIGLDILREAK